VHGEFLSSLREHWKGVDALSLNLFDPVEETEEQKLNKVLSIMPHALEQIIHSGNTGCMLSLSFAAHHCQTFVHHLVQALFATGAYHSLVD
jgi:hypothetical protein